MTARISRLPAIDPVPELRRLEAARQLVGSAVLELLAAAEAVQYATLPPVPPKAQLLTREEVAERLRSSAAYVDILESRGELTAVRLGRLVRYDEADIARFIGRLHE